MLAMSKRSRSISTASIVHKTQVSSHPQQRRLQPSGVPGLLQVSGAARSQTQLQTRPASKRRGGHQRRATEVELPSHDPVSTNPTAVTAPLGAAIATQPSSLVISQPTGRLARARAQRNKQKETSTAAADFKDDPNASRSQPDFYQRNSSYPPHQAKSFSKRPNGRTKPKTRSKYVRRQVDDMDVDTDVVLDFSESDGSPPRVSGPFMPSRVSHSEPTAYVVPPVTPPPFTPTSATIPQTSFPFFSTPPHTPPRASSVSAPSTMHQYMARPTRSPGHTRTPSAPTFSSVSPIHFPFFQTPITPVSATTPSNEPRYANSTFQHSPSPNVLPKPRFLDGLGLGLSLPFGVRESDEMDMQF